MSSILSNSYKHPLSDESIAMALKPYGVLPGSRLIHQVRAYSLLLLQWNEKIDLTAITDGKEILTRHFGESLFAVSAAHIRAGRLADVGSGAGFPGLALKLVVSDLEVVLIEPNSKRAAFLYEVVRTLKLGDVQVCRGRIPGLHPKGMLPLDWVTSRALGSSADLLTWSSKHLVPGGQLVLWLGLDDALRMTKRKPWQWQEPIPVPQSDRRVLLIGSLPR